MQRLTTLTTRSALLRDALAVMEADYATDLDLNDVARRIATSRRQLQRCFAELEDDGFRRCLARIRMRHAAELLRETPITVRAVSGRVGYRQSAQFAKAFARYYGMLPMQYRSNHQRLAA
jgi:AraC family transcriptional regulator of adaptative response / methylphosphotriester-DNA alkyltransferase methyltransferase